jgi:hypothetical protein
MRNDDFFVAVGVGIRLWNIAGVWDCTEAGCFERKVVARCNWLVSTLVSFEAGMK